MYCILEIMAACIDNYEVIIITFGSCRPVFASKDNLEEPNAGFPCYRPPRRVPSAAGFAKLESVLESNNRKNIRHKI